MKKIKTNYSALLSIVIGILIILGASGCTSDATLRNPVSAEKEAEGDRGGDIASTTATLIPIINILLDSTRVNTGEEINLRIEAVDPSGGTLDYAWSANEGTLVRADSEIAVWQAPQHSAKALLTCKATDIRGKMGSATVEITVVGKTLYEIKVLGDRSSLFVNSNSYTIGDFAPLGGAKIEVEGMDISQLTDTAGKAVLSLDSEKLGKNAKIRVSYQNWDLLYETLFPAQEGDNRSDELIFSPNFQGLTVAMGTGNAFSPKYGMIEVAPVELGTGLLTAIPEVCVNAGTESGYTDMNNLRVAVSAQRFGPEISLSLSKPGYQTIENTSVPVASSYATIVLAKMLKNGASTTIEPSISAIKPYKYNQSVAVTSPIEIVFAQPMARDSIFNDFEVIVTNKNTNEIVGLNGSDISKKATIEWKNDTTLVLRPINSFTSQSIYSFNIKKWNAYSIDGRKLKSYAGLYHEFTTASDPVPMVTSFVPVNGSSNVRRNGPFAINFDVPINPNSIYDDLSIELVNKDINSTTTLTETNVDSFFSITWTNQNKTVEFVPVNALDAFCDYTLRFNKLAVKSMTGKTATGINYTWLGFSTGGM
ncbi:MAG: Ig-like domain-containing protein [Candidatus Riflebacteria bacterium]|nr:Ig-like domain-containing protein [Candidatus Riflebacteria bacterium]